MRGGRLDTDAHCTGHHRSSYEPDQLYWPRLSAELRIPEHTKAVMIRTRHYKYVYRLYESDELYALANDPREQNNMLDNQASRGVLLELKERLLRFLVETCDVVPFAQGEREGDRKTLSSHEGQGPLERLTRNGMPEA